MIKFRDRNKRWRDGSGSFTRAPQRGDLYQDRSGRWRQSGKSGFVKTPTPSRSVGRLRDDVRSIDDGSWSKTATDTGFTLDALASSDAITLAELSGALAQWEQDGGVGSIFTSERVLISIEMTNQETGDVVFRNLSAAEDGEVAIAEAISAAESGTLAVYADSPGSDDDYMVTAIRVDFL